MGVEQKSMAFHFVAQNSFRLSDLVSKAPDIGLCPK